MFEIDVSDPLPIYAQLERAIRMAIATGKLLRGDQLPTVRQLAVDLRINANTVAKVYAELERTGVVETHRGVGTFVQGVEKGAASQSDRDRQLVALTEDFFTKAAALGLTPHDAADYVRMRCKELKREKSNG
jgi:GntR family transcriptional regulator